MGASWNCDYRKAIMKYLLMALLLFNVTCIEQSFAIEKADLVVVHKKKHRLLLYQDGRELASFHVAFGAEPEGHKQQQGDERTPEGEYVLDYKNANSKFYKSLHISYPNAEDRAAARERGVDPGGAIMIHGQANGKGWAAPVVQLFNWTNGCIALKNSDVDIVWEAVDPGTPIVINP